MAWGLPAPAQGRRGARPHPVRLAPALAVSRCRHDPRSLVRARPDADEPASTATVFPSLRPPCSRGAARVLTVSERSKADIVELYGVPAERIAVTPNGVDPVFGPGGRVRATTFSRSAPSNAGKISSRRSPPRRRPVCRSSSWGPKKMLLSLAICGGRAQRCEAMSRSRSSPRSTAALLASCRHRATRDSACRCSRRWPAAPRSSPFPTTRSSRSSARLPSSSTSRRLQTGSAGPSRTAAVSSRAGLERSRLFSWRRTAERTLARLPGGASDDERLGRRRLPRPRCRARAIAARTRPAGRRDRRRGKRPRLGRRRCLPASG